MMMDFRTAVPTLLGAVFLLAAPLFGQANSDLAQVSGIVKDPVQAVVAAAEVILTDPRNQSKVTAVTNSEGSYLFSSLQPGTYIVEVGKKGFKNSVSPELKLTAGQTVQFDVVLQLAAIGQSVTAFGPQEGSQSRSPGESRRCASRARSSATAAP